MLLRIIFRIKKVKKILGGTKTTNYCKLKKNLFLSLEFQERFRKCDSYTHNIHNKLAKQIDLSNKIVYN